MDGSRSVERERCGVGCYFDDARNIQVHCFEPGKCRCRCGQRVVRKPRRRDRLKFGRGSDNSDFSLE